MEWLGDWTAQWSSELGILLRVAVAMVLSGVIGLERELANRPAGFRTHMLVGGMAAMLVGLADPILDHVREHGSGAMINADPIRIVEAIVAGVSFLGAGTIFRRGERGGHVEGLTTAASLFAAAAIGIAVGSRQFVLATGVTVLILLVLRGVLQFERRRASADGARPPPEDGPTRRAPGENGPR